MEHAALQQAMAKKCIKKKGAIPIATLLRKEGRVKNVVSICIRYFIH
jgi:hypothetical protein